MVHLQSYTMTQVLGLPAKYLLLIGHPRRLAILQTVNCQFAKEGGPIVNQSHYYNISNSRKS